MRSPISGRAKLGSFSPLHGRTAAEAQASEPKRQGWGATMFEVTDPDGHVWSILGP